MYCIIYQLKIVKSVYLNIVLFFRYYSTAKIFRGEKSVSYNHVSLKSLRILSFSGPYFPAFGLNTEIYRVTLYKKCNFQLRISSVYVTKSAVFCGTSFSVQCKSLYFLRSEYLWKNHFPMQSHNLCRMY